MEELFALRPGRYRHFKGNEYELLYVARHSETLEPMVVYRALYGERGVWVRPAAMWSEPVDRDGYHGPRFQLGDDGTGGEKTIPDLHGARISAGAYQRTREAYRT